MSRPLTEALELRGVLHEPGQRERYRRLLERAIDDAHGALAQAELGDASDEPATERTIGATTLVAVRSTLARAHAAKAEDALHGATQLSLSAQRAPTIEACDDGWRRVATIVAGAEASARIAARMAAELGSAAKGSAAARGAALDARSAETAARAASQLLAERNHAYTFHADGGFSFGEGWYLAAAAVLAGVAVQIEPGKAGTTQAEKFLRDAGLASQLEPYRSRPRAMKQTTALVAEVFRKDAEEAQRELRRAFLGDAPGPSAVRAWVDARLRAAGAAMPGARLVLLWVRDGVHHSHRNTPYPELVELCARVRRAGMVPVLIGDALRGEPVPEGAVDMILFWKDPIFRGEDSRRAQLEFFEHLRQRHGTVGQIGVTTAGMDGPALMGLPTAYLTDVPNARMGKWVGAVPGYEEVVRESGYLERVSRILATWAGD